MPYNVTKRWVYLLGEIHSAGSPLKVGVSNNPERRCRELSNMSGRDLRILTMVQADDLACEYERRLQSMFGAHRVHGEWFDGRVREELLAAFGGDLAELPPPQSGRLAQERGPGGRFLSAPSRRWRRHPPAEGADGRV